MRKLMKKHEKNNAYDDSDDEKNPYASSVSLRSPAVITKFMIELWCLVSGGGARGGTTCHPAGPCHYRS